MKTSKFRVEMESDEEAIQMLVDQMGAVCASFRNQACLLSQVSKNESKRLDAIQDQILGVQNELNQEIHLKNYKEAFESAKLKVILAAKDPSSEPMDIKILAVSSSFSWNFITVSLRSILEGSPRFSIRLKLLLVHPQLLKKAGKNEDDESWMELSASRVRQLVDFMEDLDDDVRLRFDLSLSYYRNIPHWHGVLLDGFDLILGRTSWDFSGEEPRLLVGENEYRLFNDISPTKGSRRIKLFESWFTYYESIAEEVECPGQ